MKSSNCLFPPNDSGFLKMTEHIDGPFSWAPFMWAQKAACRFYQYNCDSDGHWSCNVVRHISGSNSDFKARPFNGSVCSIILKWMALANVPAGRTGGFQCKRVKILLGYKGRVTRMLKVLVFPIAYPVSSPQWLAWMEVSPRQMPKGRWHKSSPCKPVSSTFAWLYQFPFCHSHSLPSSPF